MGNALSSLGRAFKGIKIVIAVLKSLNAEYNELLERCNVPPGLPVENPTESFWLENPPFPELVDIKSPALPEEADIVIIGSGITGAAIARSILHECRRKGVHRRVVVVEARQLCSGATGRNGGHIKASPHETFRTLSRLFSKERAAALCRFQLLHLSMLTGLCDAEGIDLAECREVTTVDFAIDTETLGKAVDAAKEVKKWIPEFKFCVWRGEEARKVSHSSLLSTYILYSQEFKVNEHVVGAVQYSAGALWPYRLVTSVWKKLLDEFPKSLSIETGTAVQSISNSGPSDQPYEVSTSRGVIRTRHVVHATNAFASQLVPGLVGKITSMWSICSAQRPGTEFPDLSGSQSWSILYKVGYDYITQRPTVDGQPGEIILGGGFAQSEKQGLNMIGAYDDSKLDPLSVAHLGGIFPTIFTSNWGADAQGGRMKKVWSGIVGLTADFMPLVGRLDHRLTGRKVKSVSSNALDQPGEWACAGYNGDGMVWAWLCGTAVGLMIMGSENDDLPAAPGRPAGRLVDWFPKELYATYERVQQMDFADLADMLM